MTTTREWQECLSVLAEPAVSELELNGPTEVFIKRAGMRERVAVSFGTEHDYEAMIEEELVPMVASPFPYHRDRYLFEGPMEVVVAGERIKARVHVVTSPSAQVPQVTIAKRSSSLVTLDAIAAQGSLTEEMKQFLIAAVLTRQTIVVSGGTGSGKTTLLEALTKYIPPTIRIGVAEDTPELVLSAQENVTYLHSVPLRPGVEAKDVATLAWVVQQFQRMRVDRIIVGETRGGEFAQFLIAANSGMDGSLTTIHADNPVQCLQKMMNFTIEARGALPLQAVNTDIANAVDIIVQLSILPNGKHKVQAIQEVTKTVGTGNAASITTNSLYEYVEADDCFVKRNRPTDALRTSFEARGHAFETFSKADLGQRLYSNARGSSGDAALPPPRNGGGLPSLRGML